MAHSYALQLPDGVASYYLSGTGSNVYTGAGTPWDSQATTPYSVGMNDTTGQRWSPRAAEPITIYGGGPPFANGQLPKYRSYGNVVEEIPIQMRGSTYENTVALLKQLRLFLDTALFSYPPMLVVRPNGGTVDAYAEIVDAFLQEDARSINDENGKGLIRAVLRITRAPFFTLGNVETILYGVTVTNNGNSPQMLGTLHGELTTTGQPMNITLSGGALATAGVKNVWLAAIKANAHTAYATAISVTSAANIGSAAAAAVDGGMGLKTRLMARVANPTANLELRAVVSYALSSGAVVYTSPWVAPGAATGALADLGGFDLAPSVRRAGVAINITVQIQARSNTGAAATGTLSWVEALSAYTFAKLTTGSVPASTVLHTYGATYAPGGGVRVLYPPLATAGANYAQNIVVRGTLPLAFSGAFLWMVWDAAGVQSDTDTISVSADQIALYRTLIGDGL